MSNETIQIITPIINTALVAILGLIGRAIVKVAPKVIDLLVAKIGLANYQKYKAIAIDIFNKIEEDGRLGKLADSKMNAFESLIKAKIPAISDSEIELLRQAIAGEFNKDKPVIEKAIEKPIQEVQEVKVEPIVKYVAPDGTELQPINNIVSEVAAQ